MSDAQAQLVDYALNLGWVDLDEGVLHQVKRRLLDTIACAIGAYTAPPVKAARRLAPRVTEGPVARVFGTLQPTTLDMAAFVNATMVRYLDFNDTYRTVDGAHPSDNVHAVLAAAEAERSTGQDFLLATVLAYEVQCRFVDCVALNARGWDMPVSGAIASALACGRLFRLSRAALSDALAISAISNICTYQSRAGELSMWKGCAAANGARQGVFAAMLAREGITGPDRPFDGEYGLWPQTMGKPVELEGLARKGGKFGVAQSNIKRFPVKDSLQLPAIVATDLHSKVGRQGIERIQVHTYGSAYKGAAADREFWRPRTRETADHSMPFCVAAGLLDGDITPETFERSRHLDDDVVQLLQRVDIEVSDEFTRAAPRVRTCRIAVTTSSGDTVAAESRMTYDDIERGLGDDALADKFDRLTRAYLTPDQRGHIRQAVEKLDEIQDMREFTSLLSI